MNVDGANTEPYAIYHQRHDQIDNSIKIVAASLNHTIAHVAEFKDGQELGRLIAKTNSSWIQPSVWKFEDASEEHVLGHASYLGIISSFSALDDFLEGLIVEVDRANKLAGRVRVPISETDVGDSSDRVVKVAASFGWSLADMEQHLLILDYFRLVRNCMAHRCSEASPALEAKSTFIRMMKSHDLPFSSGTTTHLPLYSEGQKISLDPKMAIFFLYTSREICIYLNRQLVNQLGTEGVLRMAVYHGFLKKEPVRTKAHKSPAAVLSQLLQERYRVRVEGTSEVVRLASELGIWKSCTEQYQKIYARKI